MIVLWQFDLKYFAATTCYVYYGIRIGRSRTYACIYIYCSITVARQLLKEHELSKSIKIIRKAIEDNCPEILCNKCALVKSYLTYATDVPPTIYVKNLFNYLVLLYLLNIDNKY